MDRKVRAAIRKVLKVIRKFSDDVTVYLEDSEVEFDDLGNPIQNKIEKIVKMASYNPAEYIGINDRKGSLESGKDADILVLDKNYDLICTICRGKIEFEK